MGRPKSLPETSRECIGCKLVHPLTASHFYVSASCRNGFTARCRPCLRIEVKCRKHGALLAERERRKRAMAGAHCGECYDMPHRVTGGTCFSCGLRYEAEPKPELELRKYAGDAL